VNPITSLLSTLVEPITGLISEFVVDKDKAAEIAYRISTLAATQAHEQALGQLAVNKAEAATGSMFVGGWRPAVGWCCMTAMAVNFVITPIFGPVIEAYTVVKMVPLDMSEMMPILLGLLGLGGMRSYEKSQGVARK
tara:strand:+ start:2150 stop:2560 length:411 start_codon:yes stop_codon:yes gene_type:complete